MANRRVAIYEHVKRPDGTWTFIPADPDLVARKKLTIKQERQSRWYISWREGDKKKFKRVRSPLLSDAKKEAELKAWQLAGKNNGVEVTLPEENRLTIAAAAQGYLDDVKHSRSAATHSLHSKALDDFQAYCPKVYMDEIERADLLKFRDWLKRRKKGTADRTVGFKMLRVNIFIRTVLKQDPGRGFITKRDAQMPDGGEVEIYSDEELKQFFAACRPNEHLLFQVFLKSGFRMQEVMYLRWDDVNFASGTLRVVPKPEYEFVPKNKKSREVKVPADLMEALERHKTFSKHPLVFCTRSGEPKTHMIEQCKAVAKRAKLNSDDWWLHKFRATCGTNLLRSGIDIKTVQEFLGHKDIQSTMRYLTKLKTEQMADKIEAAWAGV